MKTTIQGTRKARKKITKKPLQHTGCGCCGSGCGAQRAVEIPFLKFDEKGLIPAIVQDWKKKDILMMAWMNKESLAITIREGRTCFWSRSRKELWRKGDTSGNVQKVKSIWFDCDADVLLIGVEQVGGIACHTGARSCFYRKIV